MAKSATQVTLSQLIDLSLNSEEVGVVNFTLLHTVLQVMVQQLDIADCNIEFRDKDSDRMQNFIISTKAGPKLSLTEYTVGENKLRKKKKRTSSIKIDDSKEPSASSVLKTGKDPVSPPEKKKKRVSNVLVTNKVAGMEIPESTSSQGPQTLVVVDPNSTQEAPRFSVAITKEQITKMEAHLEQLEAEMKELKEMPGNIGLIDAIRKSRTSDQTSPVLDMFQILNLIKRMDAVEASIEKLASMLEHLAREEGYTSDMEKKLSDEIVKEAEEIRTSIGSNASATKFARVSELEHRVEKLELLVPGVLEHDEVPSLKSTSSESERMASAAARKSSHATEWITIMKNVEFLMDKMENLPSGAGGRVSESDANKAALMQTKFNECMEQIVTLDSSFSEQNQLMQNRIDDLEKEMGLLLEKIPLQYATAGDEDGQPPSELHKKLLAMQEDLTNVAEISSKIMEDRIEKESAMNLLQEQIEILKTVKANKEDLEDALADKADACLVNKKVSMAMFDHAYDDLTKGIEEALAKLTQQENLWANALDEIQREIGGKIDKVELEPLRNFINHKLKNLQDKFKTLSVLKGEHEAAGTKNKYLRDVTCISCDKDVVMRKQMDATLNPQPRSAPPGRNIGPYLAFELDQLRKQKKCFPGSKNLNMFESALHGDNRLKKDDHICNRYCGGSHTTTTAQQRVTRMGHFLDQWGPESGPMQQEIKLKGTDGHFYKGQDDVAKKDLVESPPSLPTILSAGAEGKKLTADEIINLFKNQANEEATALVDLPGSNFHNTNSKLSKPETTSSEFKEEIMVEVNAAILQTESNVSNQV